MTVAVALTEATHHAAPRRQKPASAITVSDAPRGQKNTGAEYFVLRRGNENLLAGCIAAVNELLCDTPSFDFSRDRTALSGKFPGKIELKACRELQLRNMLNFDAFVLVDELPPEKHAYDMVWVDEWRGDWVRSRLCVRQFKAEGLRDDFVCGNARHVFHQVFVGQSCELQGFGITRCWHQCCVLCTLEPMRKFCVKVPSGIKSSRFWRLKAAVNVTRKASKHQSIGKSSHATSS